MSTGAQISQRSTEYEVLSPWADVDPVPLRGINPRPRDLAGKKIGLFLNQKRAAHLSLSAFEKELLERFPSATTSWYKCAPGTTSRRCSPKARPNSKPGWEASTRSCSRSPTEAHALSSSCTMQYPLRTCIGPL